MVLSDTQFTDGSDHARRQVDAENIHSSETQILGHVAWSAPEVAYTAAASVAGKPVEKVAVASVVGHGVAVRASARTAGVPSKKPLSQLRVNKRDRWNTAGTGGAWWIKARKGAGA